MVLFIILLVLFTLVMGVWGLALLGAISANERASAWLAFFACLILGVVVFLVGSGNLTMRTY